MEHVSINAVYYFQADCFVDERKVAALNGFCGMDVFDICLM